MTEYLKRIKIVIIIFPISLLHGIEGVVASNFVIGLRKKRILKFIFCNVKLPNLGII